MKKILKIALSAIIAIIVTLAAVPYFFKDDIEKFIKKEINKNLDATFDYDQLDLSLFRDFPNLNVMIKNIRIDGKGNFKDVRLAQIDRFKISLDAKRLFFKKDLEIKKIGLEGADFKIKVLKNGKANYDITKNDTTQTTEKNEAYTIKLKSYYVKNANLNYDDASLNMHLKIKNLNHQGQGVFTEKDYVLTTQSQIDTLDVYYDNIHYLNNVKTKADAIIRIENDFNKYTIKDGNILLNSLPLQTNMVIALQGDDTDMDITYQTSESQLKNLLSLIPKAYMPDFEGLKTNGEAFVKGYVKGIYNEQIFPAFGTTFKVEQGYIKYPDLPQAVKQINLAGSVVFPGGKDLDLTSVDLSKIHFVIAGNAADGQLKLQHLMTDPNIQTAFHSVMDLGQVKQAVYLPEIKQLNGYLKADFNLNGRLSAIEKQAYEHFKADGSFDLKDFNYKSSDLPYAVNISRAIADITPQALNLTRFESQVGESDFELKGKVTNYLSYILKKNEVLKAVVDLHSNYLNMNEFMTADDTTSSSSAQDSLIRIPKNLDVTFKADADKIRYKDLVLEKLKGVVTVQNQKAELSTILTQAFGGQMNLSGIYDTSKPNAETSLKMQMKQLAINQTAEKLTLFKAYAPALKNISGQFFSDFNMKVDLDKHMNPELQTLDAAGLFKTSNISIAGIDIVKKVSELLKIKSLSTATVDQVKAQFEINKGNMQLKPFHFKVNDMSSSLQGKVGLDQNIDFIWTLDVPRKMLGGDVNKILGDLVGKVNLLGLKTNLGDIIPIKFKIKGTYTDPKIIPVIGNTEGKDTQENVTEAVSQKVDESVDEAKKQAQKKADAILKQAETEANKIKAEAKLAADKIRVNAQKQADKLVKEAGNDPFKKLAAQAMAKKIVQEADKKAQKLETEAENKANLILKNAQEKAAKISS